MMISRRRLFGFALLSGFAVPAAAGAQVQDLLGLGQQWMDDNLDPAALRALRSGDPAQLDKVLAGLLKGFQGDYVLDLAAMQDVARLALPLLERDPRTRSYAPWLKSRLDYFQVADQLRTSLPPPRAVPGQPAVRPANPTPNQERQAWQKQVAQQPAPKGAAAWVPKLKPVVRDAGAPPELVWLAEIESSFDPAARSPAGAAGMYQLMGPTAQSLGLKLQPNDERLVPEKSARAAAVYLRKLHDQFKDWPLALAAYNAGPGRVAELLKRRRSTSFDGIAPTLPAETQMYVPKFEAVLKKREGVTLAALKMPSAKRSA